MFIGDIVLGGVVSDADGSTVLVIIVVDDGGIVVVGVDCVVVSGVDDDTLLVSFAVDVIDVSLVSSTVEEVLSAVEGDSVDSRVVEGVSVDSRVVIGIVFMLD